MDTSSSSHQGANYLEISLLSPPSSRPCYVPGDIIRGEISLHGPEQIDGLQASITLKSVSKVRLKEKGRLFSPGHSHELILLKWDKNSLARTEYPNRISWPFSFSMPSSVQSAWASHSSSSAEGDCFTSDPDHSLPPSFDGVAEEDLTQNMVEACSDKHAAIVYTLSATLSQPHHTHSYSGPTRCQRDFRFSHFRQHEVHAKIQATSLTYQISPDSLTSGVHDHNGAQAQCLYWREMQPIITLHTSIPPVVMSGQVLSVKLSFEHNVSRVLVGKLPPVVLRTIKVSVISETFARVPGGLRRDPHARWEHASLFGYLELCDIPTGECSISFIDSETLLWDLNTMIPELNTHTVDVPTFKTFNIARSYTLQIQGELSIADQKLHFEVRKPLLVLSPYSEEKTLAESLPSSSLAKSIESSDLEPGDGAPPPYAMHEGSFSTGSAAGKSAGLPSYHRALNEK